MNSEIKAQWVAALRSGEYEQGRDHLKTLGGKYCCLGVLCELAVQDGVIDPPTGFGAYIYYGGDHTSADASSTQLPPRVREWAGLAYSNPFVTITEDHDFGSYPIQKKLADENDTGKTFLQIADMIEKYL